MEVAGILCCYMGLVFYFNSRIACGDLSINLCLKCAIRDGFEVNC
jgi:hypothetical protein